MITEENVEEFLAKYSPKQFLDATCIGSEFLDHRSKVIVANIYIERLMDFLIIKKSKNCKNLRKLKFFQKQRILHKLRILSDDLNHELKIINKIRNAFAHEIDPVGCKIPQLIKKSKFYDKTKLPKTDNTLLQSKTDGMIVGMVTGILMRHLVETLWKTDSKNKNNFNH